MRIRPAIVLPAVLLASATPAWACGPFFGPEILLLVLGFFGAEAFVCALISGLLTWKLSGRTLLRPKLSLAWAVMFGTASGSLAWIAGAVVGPMGMLASTALAAGLVSAVVIRLAPAVAPRLAGELQLPPEPTPATLYETSEEWKPLS